MSELKQSEDLKIQPPPIDWVIRVAEDDFPNKGNWTHQEANWACYILGKHMRYNSESSVDLQFYIDMQAACKKYLQENDIE